MIVETVRLLITLALTAAGYAVGSSAWSVGVLDGGTSNSSVVGAVIGAGAGYVIGGVLGRFFRSSLDDTSRWGSSWSGPQLFAGAFGLVVGLVVGAVVSVPIVALVKPPMVAWPMAGLVVFLLTVAGARVFMARADDLLPVAGLSARRPMVAHQLTDSGYLLDSSAAIDGRVLQLARQTIIAGRMWVPTFVIDEIQSLADAADQTRRKKGRRGLEIIEALRDAPGLDVAVLEEQVPEVEDVDAKLIALAQRIPATLVTTDHNLAKASELRGVVVLNPQSLSDSLKSPVNAGDTLPLALVKAGAEAGQAVGYLDDGTMVVVSEAADRVGSDVDVEITGTTRTAVGRMLFARLTAS